MEEIDSYLSSLGADVENPSAKIATVELSDIWKPLIAHGEMTEVDAKGASSPLVGRLVDSR